MARKSDSAEETETSSTVDESTASRRASNPSSNTGTGDSGGSGDSGGPRGVLFTAEGADSTHQPGRVTTADDYPDSKQVRDGEWNPETHGPPPDSRPKRNY